MRTLQFLPRWTQNDYRVESAIREFNTFDELVQQVFGSALSKNTGAESVPKSRFSETDSAYSIEFELPGVREEDIDAEVRDSRFTLKASVKDLDEKSEEKTVRTYAKTFDLPDNVDIENIEATSKNGILKITFPKVVVEEQVKKLEIKPV